MKSLQLLVCAIIGSITLAAAESTTMWRGDGNGVYAEATPVINFDVAAKRHVRWQVDLSAPSPSTPIVVGDKVVVAMDPDLLACFAASDGRKLWQAGVGLHADAAKSDAARQALGKRGALHGLKGGALKAKHKEIDKEVAAILGTRRAPTDEFGLTASTPVSDGERIYMGLVPGVVAAFDLDGKRLWWVDTAKQSGGMQRGALRVVDDLVLVPGANGVTALHSRDGTTAWFCAYGGGRDKRPSTPALWQQGGKAFLVCHDYTVIRVSDGKAVQSMAAKNNLNDASPSIAGDRVIIVWGDDHSSGAQHLEAWDLSLDGDRVGMKQAWVEADRKTKKIGFTRATPLVIGDTIVHLRRTKKKGAGARSPLILQSLADGSWQDKQPEGIWDVKAHKWWSSPVQIGQHVFITDLKGNLCIYQPGSPWQLVSHQQLPDGMHCAPVAMGDALYVRTRSALICIGK